MRASLVAVLAVAPVAATVFVVQSDLLKPGPDAAREGALRQARDASARLGRFVGELRAYQAAWRQSWAPWSWSTSPLIAQPFAPSISAAS